MAKRTTRKSKTKKDSKKKQKFKNDGRSDSSLFERFLPVWASTIIYVTGYFADFIEDLMKILLPFLGVGDSIYKYLIVSLVILLLIFITLKFLYRKEIYLWLSVGLSLLLLFLLSGSFFVNSYKLKNLPADLKISIKNGFKIDDYHSNKIVAKILAINQEDVLSATGLWLVVDDGSVVIKNNHSIPRTSYLQLTVIDNVTHQKKNRFLLPLMVKCNTYYAKEVSDLINDEAPSREFKYMVTHYD